MFKEFIQRLFGTAISVPSSGKQPKELPSFTPRASHGQLEPALNDVGAQMKEYRSWAHVSVKKKAQRIAAIKLLLYRRKNEDEFEEVKSHEVFDLMDKVNNFMTRYDLFEWTSTMMDLAGECFWWKIRGAGNQVVSIYPYFNPKYMDVVPSTENFVDGYMYTVPGTSKQIPFQASDMIHFKEINPTNPYRGYSPMKAAEYAVASDRSAQRWNWQFFENSAQPKGIIIYPGTLGEEQYQRVRTQWEAGHQGIANAHKVAILENKYPDKASVDYKEIGYTQKDMDFIEQRKMSRDEIFAIFGVPKGIIMSENSNKASATVEERAFLNDTIIPKTRKIVSYLNEFLLSDYDDDLFFDFENPVIQTNEEKLAYFENGIKNGWLTPNEIRQEEGFDKVENGDNIYIPSNLIVIGTSDNAKRLRLNTTRLKRTKKEIISKMIKDELKPQLKAIFSKKKNIKAEGEEEKAEEVFKDIYTKEWLDEFAKEYIKKLTADELTFKNKSIEYFKGQEKRILKQIKVVKAKTKIKFEFDMKEEVGIAIKEFEPLEIALIQKYGDDAFAILGLDMTFNINNRVMDFMATEGLKFAKEINEVTRGNILNQIIEAEKEGEGILKIRNRIKEVFKEATNTRATAIARTETSRLANFSKLEGYKQSGVVGAKRWVTVPDDRRCFPENTLIDTQKGKKKIQDIKEGDIVLSDKGFKKVIKADKRKYGDVMVKIKTSDRREVIATEEHPVHEAEKGWIKIKDLFKGSKLQTSDNQIVKVVSIVNIKFFKAYNFITKFFEFFVPSFIFNRVIMPIISVCFETNIQDRNKKINRKTFNLAFLNKIYPKFFKSFSNSFFYRCFSAIFTITRKTTKSSYTFLRRNYSKFLTAINTSSFYNRTTTLFRAMSSFSTIVIENLSTSRTNTFSSKLMSTLQTANFVPMRYTLGDDKRFITDRTYFSNSFNSFSEAITFNRTISPFSFIISIERFFTIFTYYIISCFCRFMIAIFRTINITFLSLFKIFLTILTPHIFILNTYRYYIKQIASCKAFYVYNFEVEDAHTYFAEGILVHNCDYCAPMEGKIVGLDTNYFNKGDTFLGNAETPLKLDYADVTGGTLHVNCRCTIVPIPRKQAMVLRKQQENDKKNLDKIKDDIKQEIKEDVSKVKEEVMEETIEAIKEAKNDDI